MQIRVVRIFGKLRFVIAQLLTLSSIPRALLAFHVALRLLSIPWSYNRPRTSTTIDILSSIARTSEFRDISRSLWPIRLQGLRFFSLGSSYSSSPELSFRYRRRDRRLLTRPSFGLRRRQSACWCWCEKAIMGILDLAVQQLCVMSAFDPEQPLNRRMGLACRTRTGLSRLLQNPRRRRARKVDNGAQTHFGRSRRWRWRWRWATFYIVLVVRVLNYISSCHNSLLLRREEMHASGDAKVTLREFGLALSGITAYTGAWVMHKWHLCILYSLQA